LKCLPEGCCFNGPNKWKSEKCLPGRQFNTDEEAQLEEHHPLLGLSPDSYCNDKDYLILQWEKFLNRQADSIEK
jgi:hypothetical protein